MILVTGGSGFVGSYLIRRLLKQGNKVRAIRRQDSRMDLLEGVENDIEWIETDLLNMDSVLEAMDGVAKVYHCAAKISFQNRELDYMHKVNVEGTANMVNAALESGIEKFLHVSSIAAVGRRQRQQHLDEKTQWEHSNWNSRYAVSKHCAEREVWRAVAEGLNAVIVNPSVILGAGSWTNGSGLIFKKNLDGLWFYPAGISGFVDIRDVVGIMTALMESDIHSERFIINAENLDYKDLFARISRALDRKAPRIPFTRWMSRVAYRLEGALSYPIGRKPFLTKELVHNTGGRFHYNNTKLINHLDWEYIPIVQTIEDTCRVIKETHTKGYGVFPE